MKVRVISARRPWIDGAPREIGYIGEVEDATVLLANGLAEIVEDPASEPEAPKKRGRPAKVASDA